MIVLYVVAGLALLWSVLFIIFSAPVKNPEIKKYTSTLYAHRGLHNVERAENSMSAFRAAVEAGYGMELDIRLSKDGKLVVFHDDTLNRVAGIDGKVIDFTAEELAEMSLNGTSDGVPLFEDVLKMVDGRAPILVEIKEDAGCYAVSDAAAEMLKDYKGPYIVESFNPLSLWNFGKKLPDVPRGILAESYYKSKERRTPLYYLLSWLLLNRWCKPCFIAYNKRDKSAFSLNLLRCLFRVTTFAWTVKSEEEEKTLRESGFDGIIFEDYLAKK